MKFQKGTDIIRKFTCPPAIIIILALAVNAIGEDFPEPKLWINDYAGVLTSSQKQEINDILKNHENRTTEQIVVCIMKRIPSGYTLETYVNTLFSKWELGQKEKDNGVLIAIFIEDRKLRIEVGYGPGNLVQYL